MRMNLENASRSWGRQRVQERGDAAHVSVFSMDVNDPCDEVQLVFPKAECTSKRRVLRTLDIQCIQQVIFATCPLRHHSQ